MNYIFNNSDGNTYIRYGNCLVVLINKYLEHSRLKQGHPAIQNIYRKKAVTFSSDQLQVECLADASITNEFKVSSA